MKNKISILTITLILTIIIFAISTYVQKKLIDYEPTISCLVLNADIEANQKLTADMFKLADIPISLVSTTRVINDFSSIDGLYARDNIYKNQIAMLNQFDTKENLAIFEVEEGKEKISIKLNGSENAVSYAVKENSVINLYVTVRSDYAKDFLLEQDRLSIGDEYDGYTVIKLIDSVKVLGTFNVDGTEVKNSQENVIDSVMIAVTPEEAKQINLLRNVGTFNITGVNNQNIL